MGDWDRAALDALREAVSRRDGAEALEWLRTRPLAPVLQYAGDALVAALEQRVEGAEPYARRCLDELAGRGLPGDAELAGELSAALGISGVRKALTAVPVDLGQLGEQLDGEPDGDAYVVDLESGDVLQVGEVNGEETGTPEPAFDPQDEAYDPGRWLQFWPQDEHQLRDMADFAAMTQDERLMAAAGGRNPAWRFERAVSEGPEDFRWLLFREERRRGRARAWLADRGYRAGRRRGR